MKGISLRFAVMTALVTALANPVPSSAREELNPIRIRTVVIDPGHGGKDAGCVSRDRKTYEKNLSLDISRRVARMIKAQFPDVNVILTRDDDRYITLDYRAMLANERNADLFMSVHINAQDGGTNANGYSIHVLGQSARKGNDLFSKNLDMCKRENSVIKLEDDYSTKYQGFDPSYPQSYIFFSLIQNANLEQSLEFAEDINSALKKGPFKRSRGVWQDPLWVLWRTTMPAVLVECGFISNLSDLEILREADKREKIAECLAAAFASFKTRNDGVSAQVAQPPSENGIKYGTQVLATRREIAPDDPWFMGYQPLCIPTESGINRYFIGVCSDKDMAVSELERIKTKIPDAFIVKIDGDKVSRY